MGHIGLLNIFLQPYSCHDFQILENTILMGQKSSYLYTKPNLKSCVQKKIYIKRLKKSIQNNNLDISK